MRSSNAHAHRVVPCLFLKDRAPFFPFFFSRTLFHLLFRSVQLQLSDFRRTQPFCFFNREKRSVGGTSGIVPGLLYRCDWQLANF